jgi:DnaA family protein
MRAQLALDLRLNAASTFDNFVAGDNSLLVTLLQCASDGGGEQQLFIWGESCSGKSHLLQAVCSRAVARGASIAYLPLQLMLQHGSDVLQGFESSDVVCVDDVHVIAGHADWQEALFHFINHMRQHHKHLILSANLPPNELKLQLEDLRSRLNWGPVMRIQPLNDTDKQRVLQMHAAARGLDMPDAVASYILNNDARDLRKLFERLDQLEQLSLQQQRKLTVPFVKSVFDSH